MARRRLAVAALVWWMGVASAGFAAASPTTEVEKYLAGLKAWSAEFEQSIDDGHGKVLRSASGKFYLLRPGKFRWDYEQPSEQLILANGKEIWFYDKDLAQANVRDMDSTLASTPAMLLSGGSVGDEFDITELPAGGGLTFAGYTPPDGAQAMSMNFNFSQTTQYGGGFGVTSITQNGYATGQLSTVAIDSSGVVSAVYTNGRSTELGQLAMANFPNPGGLKQLGDTNWAETFQSGTLYIHITSFLSGVETATTRSAQSAPARSW